ncbi:Serine/threonine-protein kinase PknK [compost metagenome]
MPTSWDKRTPSSSGASISTDASNASKQQAADFGALRNISTKYATPNAASTHLARARLLEQMENAGTAKLILIRAAAGFGKTTLLQQFRQRCLAAGKPTLWINLDAADNDLQRFTLLIGNGLRTILPADAQSAASSGQESQDLLDLIAGSETPFVTILDEFEVLQNPEVLSFIQQLLDALPGGSTLAMASRSTPGIGLGRIRARGQLLEIKPSDLRFTLEEAMEFIRDKRDLHLRDADIATLYKRTEGWIAGLYLASLSLKGRDDQADFISSFSGSNLELAEYLTEDILSRQTEECREFLLQTSILGQFSASLCDAVTGRDDSRAMLEQLERANLFLLPVDSQQQWFRYHNLFASFLRDALERQHPGKAKKLHEIAARWFLAAQQPIPAIEHLFNADLLDEAATRLAEHLGTLMDNGRTRLLVRWLDRLPESTLDRYPNLGLVYAWMLALSSRMKDAIQIAERLERGAKPEHIYVAKAIRCMQLSITDQVEECCKAGIELLDLVPQSDVHLYSALAHTVANTMVSSGRYDEARRLLAHALQRDLQGGSGFLRFGFSVSEAILDLIQGRLSNALTRLQTVSESYKTGSKSRHDTTISLNIALALLHYESNALAEAERILTRNLPFTRYLSSPDLLINSHVLSARIAYLQGDRNTWLRCLVELEQLGQHANSPRMQCSVWLERARVAILEGRLDTATQALHEADQASDWDRPGVLRYANDVDTPSIARQRLRIAQGQFTEAASFLREAIEDAHSRQHHRREIKLHLLLALALDGMQNSPEAFEELNQALRLAGHEGFLRTFIDEGEPMAQLLQRWAASGQARSKDLGIEPNFVETLLQQLNVAGESAKPPVTEGSDVHQILTEREIQVLQLLAAGHRNREIAEKVFLSEFTVKSHLQKIYAKLDAKGRTEALAIAHARGWIN